MKLRKISKNDVAHLRFLVRYDFDLKAFHMDCYSHELSLIVPFRFPFCEDSTSETPPFVRFDLLKEGYIFSHAVFNRFFDGRIDVEYVYSLDLPEENDDDFFIPSSSCMLLEKQLQSINFLGYYKKVLEILKLIQRYE